MLIGASKYDMQALAAHRRLRVLAPRGICAPEDKVEYGDLRRQYERLNAEGNRLVEAAKYARAEAKLLRMTGPDKIRQRVRLIAKRFRT